MTPDEAADPVRVRRIIQAAQTSAMAMMDDRITRVETAVSALTLLVGKLAEELKRKESE